MQGGAGEPLASVPEVPRGVHCCSNFFYFFSPASVSVSQRIYLYMHVSECVGIVYELTLLPNNTAREIFLNTSGALRSLD
jgi:hypothetical protein